MDPQHIIPDVTMDDSSDPSSLSMSMGNQEDKIQGSNPTLFSSCSPNVTQPLRGRSKVWSEFDVGCDGKKVICRQCGDQLSYSNSHSTSSMLKHLKRKHNMDLYPSPDENRSTQQQSADSKPKPRSTTNRGNQPMSGGCSETPDSSIQHGPLLFADPCVRMRWTDHSDTFLRTFSVMYNDESYTDVTLIAENQFFKAHRVILSSASELFHQMFKATPPGQHPLIFLKDVKAMELRILLDFIYKGEVAIPPNLIPALVKVGGELKIRGLCDFVWNDSMAATLLQGFHGSSPSPSPSYGIFQSSPSPQDNLAATAMAPEFITPNHMSTTSLSTSSSNKATTAKNSVKNFGSSTSNSSLDTPIVRNSTDISSSSALGKTLSKLLANLRTPNVGSSINSCGGSNNNQEVKRIRLIATPIGKSSTEPSSRMDNTSEDPLGGGIGNSGGGTAPVLVLTNSGQSEAVLSTSEGGITFVTTPQSMNLGTSYKGDQLLSESTINATSSLNSPSITVLSTGSTNDINEVVYSVAEASVGPSQVLMSGTSDSNTETIVVYGNGGSHNSLNCDLSVDKKPFHLQLPKT